MNIGSIGFIGGGRVVRILLTGMKRAGASFDGCLVSDSDPSVLESLQKEFPEIRTTGSDNAEPARSDVVFAALHPPALKNELPRLRDHLRGDAILVSLAPVIRLPPLGRSGRRARTVCRARSGRNRATTGRG